MTNTLKQTYYKLVAPAIAGFVIIGAVKAGGILRLQPSAAMDILARIVFFLTAVFAIALPLLLRTLFVHRNRNRKQISEPDLLAFEQRFLYSSMPAPYLALIAYSLDFTPFYVTGCFLLALYAVYYYFPSRKRITLEKRIFRLP